MIQFDKDGVTLFYIDANGNKVSHNYMEGAAYDAMEQIRSAQIQTASDNTQAAASYATALSGANTNYGRPGFVLPVKPLMKVTSDTGDVTFVPFVPALPDFVPPVTTPSGPIAVPTVDKQAIQFNMIQAMFRKMFPDA